MTGEKKQKYLEVKKDRQKEYRKNMSDEQKQKRRDLQKKYQKNMTDEKKTETKRLLKKIL